MASLESRLAKLTRQMDPPVDPTPPTILEVLSAVDGGNPRELAAMNRRLAGPAGRALMSDIEQAEAAIAEVQAMTPEERAARDRERWPGVPAH